MDSRIIGVEPAVPAISLTWMIGSRCNYDCMYCPQELHDATSAHPDLEKLKQAWHNFYTKTQHINLPYKISFTGGEVTANKSFLPLLEYMRNGDFGIGQLLVTTNGSASLNYYRRLCDLADAVSFSTHSEFFDEADFFSKVEQLDKIMVRPEKSLHVNIMDEFWNQDRIQLYQKWLQQRQISYSINSINYGQKNRTQILSQGKQNLDTV
jgi:molybdenum cofactor biosynthesis enzyme MoaA